MNVAFRTPQMTRETFLDWADAQNERHEFDGFQPVAMTGGLVDHSRICQNLYAALRSRLRGTGCEVLGPDAGVATIGDAVRYPDALVTCTRGSALARLVEGVVAVFEVLSPCSGRVDRLDKVLEYRAVPSIRHYAILEHASVGVTVFTRAAAGQDWTATAATGDGLLTLAELGFEVPLAELFQGVVFEDSV